MQLSRLSLIPPALLFLSASAAAQWTLETRVPKSAVLGSADPKGSVALEATGDGHLDLFVRFGSAIAFFDNVWQGGGGVATGVTCTDFAAAPGEGPGGVAALAFVDAAGLKLLRRNAIYSTSFAFDAPVLLEAGSWTGAKIVRAADLDRNGTTDYVGLAADGRTILLRRDTGSGPVTTQVDTTRDQIDIVLLNWQGSENLEIAALSNNGVEVRNLNLGQVDAIAPSGHNSVAIARLPLPAPTEADPGHIYDALAWIGTNTVSLHTDFAVLRKAAPRIQNLGELDPVDASAASLATGNLSGTPVNAGTGLAATDVVVQRASGRALWFLKNTSSTAEPLFDLANKSDIDWSSNMANSSSPVVARFSGAKRAEVLVPAYGATEAELAILRSPMASVGSSDILRLLPENSNDVPPEALCMPVSSQPLQREFRVGVRFPTKEIADPQGSSEALRIEVTIFTGAPGLPNVLNTVSEHERYWINWPANWVNNVDLVLQGLNIYAPSGSGGEETCEFAPRFFEIRQVRVNTTNLTVVESGEAYTFGYCRNNTDYTTYWPTTGSNEGVDLHTHVNDSQSYFTCNAGGGNINPVHAQAIVARRKPNPLQPAPVLLPVPESSATIQ